MKIYFIVTKTKLLKHSINFVLLTYFFLELSLSKKNNRLQLLKELSNFPKKKPFFDVSIVFIIYF